MNLMAIHEKSVRMPELQRVTGMSRAWLYREIRLGRFPRPAYRFGRAVAWSLTEVSQWLAEQRAAV